MSAEDVVNDLKKMVEEMSGKPIPKLSPEEEGLDSREKVLIVMRGLDPAAQQLVSLTALIKLFMSYQGKLPDEEIVRMVEVAITIYRGRVTLQLVATLLPMLMSVIDAIEGGIANTKAEILAAQLTASIAKFAVTVDKDNEEHRQLLIKLLEPLRPPNKKP